MQSDFLHSRRDLIRRSGQGAVALAAVSAWPSLAFAQAAHYKAAAFEAKTVPELLKALGLSALKPSNEVTLTAPDIAENGAVVPVGAATGLSGVRSMLILVEGNPSVLSAMFDVSDAIDANFATRVKMGQTSNVYAVAVTSDGQALFALKEVKVTAGGCGG
jgi:sulfur-oxidizing protein SoxY